MTCGLGGIAVVGACILACFGAMCATATDEPDTELPVEPEVRAAFKAALERYPQPLRTGLAEIGLVREADYGVPDDAPLMLRLMGHAAYAYFSPRFDRVVLLDAGLAQRARWTGGDVDAQALAGLMDDLSESPDADHDGIEARWAAFVEEVQSWDDRPIEGVIRLGDERVLDRFVRLGVGRSLARPGEEFGTMDLEAQILHELAHALQLSGSGSDVSSRLEAWGRLSGWVRRDTGEPFNGYHGGAMTLEHPAVLGRLLLQQDRGDGLYAHAPEARFVNLYAAYDPREDYAESMRLFFEDPGRLLAIAPTKFLFINALGYNGSLDVREPGPLWVDAEEFTRRGWSKQVQDGVRELLMEREQITADPRTVVALLRAHAEVLSAEGLPRRAVFQGAPEDVPDPIAVVMQAEDFSVEIDGVLFGPSPASVEVLLGQAVADRYDDDLFYREMGLLIVPEIEEFERLFDELADQQQPESRAVAAARLFEHAWGIVPERRYAMMLRREVRFLRDRGRGLLAEALLLRSASVRGGEVLRDRIERSARDDPARSYDEIELQAALVAAMLASGELEPAIEAAGRIEGKWWGRVRRIEALCDVAAASGRAEILDRAAAELAASGNGSLSGCLQRMIVEAQRVISDNRLDKEEQP